MPTPLSCIQCSRPLVSYSQSGLCPNCEGTRVENDLTAATRPLPPIGAVAKPNEASAIVSQTPTLTLDPAATTAPKADESRPPPLPEPPPGYELLDRLGVGGMGVVYLARELASERIVAMKFLHQPWNSEVIDRFVVELRALTKLEHPHVVRVLASDFLRAEPYFTMEYLAGGSLTRWLHAGSQLPICESVVLMRTIAYAVAAAHAEKILHRDIKPSNILLAADGTPKLSDFGLAKRLEHDDDLTRTGGTIGTASYMPPEQISSQNGTAGPWSDVYGWGATLYHLLTGQPPFHGKNPQETMLQVVADPPTRPRTWRPEIPRELEAIILKCLEKKPADRYASMDELIADIDRYLNGQQPHAPLETGWRKLKRQLVRRQFEVAAAVVAVVVLAGAFWLGQHFQPTPVADPSPEELIQGQLQAGHPVTLIEATGYPPWLKENWLIHPTGLGRSATAGGACSFESLQPSLLAFVKDPGVPHYRITAELRILRSGLVTDPQQPPTLTEHIRSGVGLFLAHRSAQGADGSEAHGFLLIEFNDYLPQEIVNQGLTQAAVQPIGMLIVARPEAELDNPRFGWYNVKRFPPAPTLPGDWRVIQVEVHPHHIKFFWSPKPGQPPVLIGESSLDTLKTKFAQLQEWLDRSRPELNITLPPWSSRAPIGIWSNSSAVAVRNVILEPLPPYP